MLSILPCCQIQNHCHQPARKDMCVSLQYIGGVRNPVTAIVLARRPFSLPGQFDPRCVNPCAIFHAELLDQGSHPFTVVRPKNRRLLRQSIKCSHDRLNFEDLPAKHGERTSQQVCV